MKVVSCRPSRFFSCLSFCWLGLLLAGSCLGQGSLPGSWANRDVDLSSLYGVRVVAAQGDVLYAGGTFSADPHQNAFLNHIAKWTTNGWESLGSGITSGGSGSSSSLVVHAIAVSGNDVYVGGTFTNAGGLAVNNIARWDGAAWHALGSGLLGQPGHESSLFGGGWDDVVHAIVVDGNHVYVAGSFTNAGGVAATNIAMWDGANWSALGKGSSDRLDALAFANGKLYAAASHTSANGPGWGGKFFNSDDTIAAGVAQWDGSKWSSLTTGYIDNNGLVRTLAVNGSDIYIGGSFYSVGGAMQFDGINWTYKGGFNVTSIAHWNGSSWSSLGAGLALSGGGFAPPLVESLVFQGTNLFVGGMFTSVGTNITAGAIARWDGNAWFAVGAPGVIYQPNAMLSPQVSAIAFWGQDVVIGGELGTAVGDLSLGNNAMSAGDLYGFDGAHWYPFGGGVFGTFSGSAMFAYPTVNALVVDGTNTYVGGNFLNVAARPASGIARISGQVTYALGAGVDGPVQALLAAGTNLYVGGSFTNAGQVASRGLARWDGAAWKAVGAGVNGTVYALASFNGALIVGGDFQGAGTNNTLDYLAAWDGTNWSAVGVGVDGPVYSLLANGTNLYVAGAFANAGGVPANSIACWEGNSWSTLGLGLRIADFPGARPAPVYCLAQFQNKLYAGGAFWLAGTNSAGVNNIAAWDGTNWATCGVGLTFVGGGFGASPSVRAMAVADGSLYVTGEMLNSAGDNLTLSGLAAWNGMAWAGVKPGLWNHGYTYQTPSAGSGYALAVLGDEVLIGGSFGAADELPASGLAVWVPGVTTPINSQPVLSFSLTNGQLTFTWPVQSTGMTLEQSAALGGLASWSAVPGSQTTNTVTVGITSPAAFFRLRQ